VQGLGDPPVFGERLAQRGRVAVAAEHAQQVIGADLAGDQGPGHAQHVVRAPPTDPNGQFLTEDARWSSTGLSVLLGMGTVA